MTIGSAIQKGKMVYVYDEAGRILYSKVVTTSRPRDGLKGYTGSTITIQSGGMLMTYDEKGSTKFTKVA